MKLLVLDTETTGIDPVTCVPVQISLIMVEDGETSVLFNELCNPGIPIPSEASEIHRITDAMVSSARPAEIVAWAAEYAASQVMPDVLITYNGKLFDVPILSRVSGSKSFYFETIPHIDVLDLAYRYVPSSANHRLGTLYKLLAGKERKDAHDALVDVRMTYEVFDIIRTRLQMSVEDVIRDMSWPRPYHIMPISKHKGKLLREVPRSFANWLLKENKDKPMRPDLRASMEAILNGTA